MKNLKISDNFDIEDIHKIRENHYEECKNLSREEIINFYNNEAKEFCKKYLPNAKFKSQ